MIKNCNLSEKAISEINQVGFIVIKGFFSREAISDIEALMIEHFYMQAELLSI